MGPFTRIASVLFALIALVHLYRLVHPFEFSVAGHEVAQWVSGVGALIAGTMAFMLHREARR